MKISLECIDCEYKIFLIIKQHGVYSVAFTDTMLEQRYELKI